MMKQLIFASGLAMAAVAAYSQTTVQAQAPNGAIITLTQEKGPCIKDAFKATWLSPDKKETIVGCWTANDTVVGIVWLDGDSSNIPKEVFKLPSSL